MIVFVLAMGAFLCVGVGFAIGIAIAEEWQVRIAIGDLAVYGDPPRDIIVKVVAVGVHKVQVEDANDTLFLVDDTELRPYLWESDNA